MDEPPRGHLRPARPGGLTSPDPGHRAPKAPAATRQTASQHPRQGPVDKPPKRKRQESHTAITIKITSVGPPGQNAITRIRAVDRGLAGVERISLVLRYVADRLIIEVSDPDSRPPVFAEADDDAEGGRGLMLVQALSKEWSFYLPPAGGKVVYCVLAAMTGT